MITGSMPPYVLSLVVEAALAAGVPRDELNRIPGVQSLDQNGVRLPTTSLTRIWELSARAFADVGGAPRVAGLWSPGRLHVWDYLITSAANLTEAFQLAAQHMSAVTDPDSVFDVRQDGAGNLVIAPSPASTLAPVARLIVEFVFGLVLNESRAALGRQVVPLSVAIPFDPPQSHQALVDLYGTTSGELSLERVAHRLVMSPRTFQRRLHDQGTSWREEVEKVRSAEATRLLRDSDLGVASIAARVGYSDIRALRRAFHRWHGESPAQLRQAMIEQSSRDPV